ncbi:NDP-hexose 2,3-dehydratase family protein [Candidatus Pelagibacter sp.]|nr:NDP-hexose 2,3-dehydratase family protein [Candidatus Pelagibacter sp.]
MKTQLEILSKIEKFKTSRLFKKKRIQFINTKNWKFENLINHTSNKFFKIYGYLIRTNFPKLKKYYQPLISQDEVGYLVMFKAIKDNKTFYLLQLKAEPGNRNTIQLSPTIQATKSNYMRIHGGKKTQFIEYTKNTKNFLLNTNQPEQGSRYLNKYNKNIIIKTEKFKLLTKNFIWVEQKDLEKLSKKNNLLNMDTISILSCNLKKKEIDIPINSIHKIKKKYSNFKKKYKIKLSRISLKKMKNWIYNNREIFDNKKKNFKIESYKIITNYREVTEWSQPLVSDFYKGLNVLLTKKINGTTNYLCQIILEPGYKVPKFTNTIMLKNLKNKYFLKSFLNKNKINKKKKLIEVINSDEGGRFNNNQSQNIVYEIDGSSILKKQNYIWISHNQMLELLKKKLLTIELRNLFGLLNIKDLK